MAEVIIPPWVRPESPETIRMIDDATIAFPPAFGRGTTQRGIWADPRWGLRRRYRGLRSDEKAAILNALSESRGQFNVIRVTPHAPLRGSFATSELLVNNTFSNGTSSWTNGGSAASLSASDRVLRISLTDASANPKAVQSATGSTYVPYVARALLSSGRGGATFPSLQLSDSSGLFLNNIGSNNSSALLAASLVPAATTLTVSLFGAVSTGIGAGDYFSSPYTSLARCALADGGANLLLQSEAFGTAPWGVSAASISANTDVAPDGQTAGDSLVDTVTNTFHYVTQTVTVTSSAVDLTYSVALKKKNRNWATLQIQEVTGGLTAVFQYFDLNSGVLGASNGVGASWANLRSSIAPLGNGWYQCTITARKTSAVTSLSVFVVAANSDGVSSYAGSANAAVTMWRATLATASVPGRLVQTTSSATTGADQTGGALYTKGWPASTSGLLLTGDWFEINGELKRLTAPVNSDASGLAYMQFRPGIADSPADSDPVIVYEPFGRFIYPAGTRELENLFGIYGDCEMNLEEVYV